MVYHIFREAEMVLCQFYAHILVIIKCYTDEIHWWTSVSRNSTVSGLEDL